MIHIILFFLRRYVVIGLTGRRLRRRPSVLRFRLAVGSRVRFVVRIAGRLGLTMSRYNVALGERSEARSHHVVLREQSSAVADAWYELGYSHLLGPEVPAADNEHKTSKR